METPSLKEWTPELDAGFLDIICEYEHLREAFERIGVEWDAFLVWVWNFGAPADKSLRTALQCASYILTGHYGYAPRVPHMVEQSQQYYPGGGAMVPTTADRHGFAIKPNLFGLGMAMRNLRSHINTEHVSKMVKKATTSQSSCQSRLVVNPSSPDFPLTSHTHSLCQVLSEDFAKWAPLL